MNEMITAFETNIGYKFLRVILYALLLTPLWIWSGFLFPFITTKALYFRLLVELALIIYIPLALKYPQLRPRWNWLTGSVWIYIGAIFFTSLVGLDFNHSFWGTVERGEGIITLLHFAAYFTILPTVFRTTTDWYRYLFSAVLVTLAVAVYGLAQLLNLPFTVETGGGTRISGTIGNAAFFAAFLVFGIFLSLYLLKLTPSGGKRLFLKSIFVFELIMLFQSQTRGALVGVVVAFVLYFAVNFFLIHGKRARIIHASLLALLILGSVLIYTNRGSEWVKGNATLRRMATISLSDVTTQSRLDTWSASWKGWKERFWGGYGYENYDIAFNKHFPARIFKDQGSQIWFDRAHNVVLDIGVTSGIFGLLAYLGIFGVAVAGLYRLFRLKAEEVKPQQSVILALLLLAYFLQNLFLFDTHATYLMFFVALAHVVFLQEKYFFAEDTRIIPADNRRFVVAAGSIFGLAILVGAYFINLKPAMANIASIKAISASRTGNFEQAKVLFEQSLSYGTYMDQEIRERLVDYLQITIGSNRSQEEKQEIYQFVLQELKKSIEESPHDAKNYLYLITVLNRYSSQAPANYDRVMALGEKALELSPTRPQIYFELGWSSLAQHYYDTGLGYFLTAIDLNPYPKESHLNFITAAIIAGREDLAEQQKEVLTQKIGYPLTAVDYDAIGKAYIAAKNYTKAAESYGEATALDPANFEYLVRLAAIYGELCEQEKAASAVYKAIDLNQSFIKEGRNFLTQVENKCDKQ
ncbi:MAG: O-antigen ligase family protein [Candidatus Doudnabacteria bacterium]|nr:O-antigen ligase family protein [Candidatus Doudnabacteria bacterium]